MGSNADYISGTGLADPYGMTSGKTAGIKYQAGQTGTLYQAHKDTTQPDYVKTGSLELERLKAIEEAANKAIEKKKII
jgi:hypothetical protein